jgi:enediyne biosynthesis protein E4
MRRHYALLFLVIALAGGAGCKQPEPVADTLFRVLNDKQTGIEFNNALEYSEALNIYTFKNFYNGGGVGIADFNNDSLRDIFFCGNQVANKLYLNKGNLTFEDISEKAGLSTLPVWTTGISIADVNADGLLDIYLCKSGPPEGNRRKNELLINNGDLTFTDRAAEYGLDFEGLSTHAAFFDFDRDGDLDCYLLNNSIRSVGAYDLRKDQRQIPDTLGGNALLRNDQGKFIDVSSAAGIFTSSIGFGLGVTVGDVNGDHWPDMYVSNDFFEKDYLYINNQNGSFTESLEQYLTEISLGSMGADMADINNDGKPEIFVTEMLPETDERLKTTVQFENWDKYMTAYQQGYSRQFSRNVLQLNNGDQSFSEISRFARVEATDWSWGALIFDMDNDGWKDIFVANGMYKDLLDQDYINFASNPNSIRKILSEDKGLIKRLVDSIPSNRVGNFAFRNNGDLTFTNQAGKWGLAQPSFSNGSAYGDLDNDGDLDLVINNVNMPAFVIENRTREMLPGNSSISVVLHGEGGNVFAIGSRVTVYAHGNVYTQELSPMRGFMSTVDYQLTFGLGNQKDIDSIVVEWPDGSSGAVAQPAVNKRIDLFERDASHPMITPPSASKPVFTPGMLKGLAFTHTENDYVDFDRDPLLFNMNSNEGPCTCTGDVNGDGLVDVYIGGAAGQGGSLFIQNPNGGFARIQQELFDADAKSEDTDCIFFDSNQDGTSDLYVASGGTEFSSTSLELLDRLYVNNKGKFTKSPQLLPGSAQLESTSSVDVADIDGDGDLDIFAGARLVPGMYGLPANGHILINDGKGIFSDATSLWAPALTKLGMITDAKWVDVNNDDRPDLAIVGEWMPLKIFVNTGGKLNDESVAFGLSQTEGWYHTIEVSDLNGDGYQDLVVGNHGLNSRFRATPAEPLSMYVNDFDRNGSIEHITTRYYSGTQYPMVLRSDLVKQLPALKKKYLQFSAYSKQRMEDIFSQEQLSTSTILSARTFETAAWINQAGKTLKKATLPASAQFAPTYAITSGDYDGDGNMDLLLGGNQFRAKPESGIYAATRGLLLLGDGKANFNAIGSVASGFTVTGEIRRLTPLVVGKQRYVLITRNNDAIILYRY